MKSFRANNCSKRRARKFAMVRNGPHPPLSLRERRTAQPPAKVNRELPPRLLEMLRQRGRTEIISKTLRTSIDDSLLMELDAIAELGETESTRNLIRNFFLADKYRKGSSKTAGRENCARRRYRRGRDGLRYRAMAQLATRLRYFARCKFRSDRSRPHQHRQNLRRSREARTDERRKSEARPGLHCRFHRAGGDARRPNRDRSGVRKNRNQKDKSSPISQRKSTTRMRFSRQIPPRSRLRNLAARTESPERVIGLHFFNPVSRMKLVEVVIGKQTAPTTRTERALAFTRQIGKLPVVVQDSPGFLVNRVLFPYLLDAAELFRERRERKRNRRRARPMGDANGAAAFDR